MTYFVPPEFMYACYKTDSQEENPTQGEMKKCCESKGGLYDYSENNTSENMGNCTKDGKELNITIQEMKFPYWYHSVASIPQVSPDKRNNL